MRKVLTLITATALALGLLVAPAGAGGAAKVVRAVNFEFKPKTLTITKGTKVTWKNVSGTHTVTFKTLNFDKTISANRKTVSKTFRQKGTFRYVCSFHKSFGMTGKVIVQ
jgi:plastocyanin